MYQRTGACNQCGECCGSISAPNPASPYPKNWIEAIRHWSLDDANEVCPQLTMFGVANQGDQIGYDSPNGSYKIGPEKYYYVWVSGSGCCKDISTQHNGSSWNTECPFLEADPGDGSRPCGLVGTSDDGARKKFCRPEEHSEYEPSRDLWTADIVEQWQRDHPSCSYVFVEV